MLRWSLLSLVLLLVASAGARAEETPRVPAAIPSWVVPIAVPTPSAGSELDTETLLIDEQERAETGASIRYEHIGYAVRSAAGVQRNSELSISRSSDDQLSWHFVRLQRGGASKELLPGLEIKVIQPEEQLAGGIYDGSRREVIILEDVRPGDVIEYAYSVRSKDAVRGGRFVSRVWLGRSTPVRRFHFAASWPQDRQVSVRAFGVTLERPSEHAVRFVRDEVPAYPGEAREPAWFDATPRLELSEFASWADVVSWALPLYSPVVAPQVKALARELQGTGSLEEGVARAIRFVQDDVRYLGLEEGERALVPHAPEQVLTRRFGDCKDKTLLLVTLLRTLGVQAEPALVSSRWERGVAEALPSTMAFDHVVVHTLLDGDELWVDPTRSFQRGPVKELSGLPFGRALLLRAGESGLREVPTRALIGPQVTVRERFGVTVSGSANVEVTTTYRGEEADSMRAKLARSDRAEIQKGYLDFYAKNFGPLSVREPLGINDDPRHNTLVVNEQYTLTKFWQRGEQTVAAWLLLDSLPLPAASRAKRPFALPHPLHVRHVIEIFDRKGWQTETQTEHIEGTAFLYDYRSHHEDNVEIIEHELRSKADHVAVAGLDAYAEIAKRARDRTEGSYVMDEGEPASKPMDDGSGALVVLGIFAALGLIVFFVDKLTSNRSSKRKRRFESKKRFARGEAPESAILVRAMSDAVDELRRIRCCNAAPFTADPPAPQELRYADGKVVAFRGKCGQCRRLHARYFAIHAP